MPSNTVHLKLLTFVSATVLLGACASDPIIDTRGVNMAQYEQDLQECEAYAEQVNVGRHAAGSAVAGAAVGAVVGAVVGDSSSAARGAGAGATVGATKGTGRGLHEKQRVVHNCLAHRGYAVLN